MLADVKNRVLDRCHICSQRKGKRRAMANRSAVTRHYLVESDFADLAKARAMKNLALTLYR